MTHQPAASVIRSAERTAMVPWALGRVSELPDSSEPSMVPEARLEIDPATQTAQRLVDGTMVDPMEAGKHGRITNTYKPTGTNVDGGPGGGRRDTDTNPDARPDPGGCL